MMETATDFEILRTLTHEQALQHVGKTFRLMHQGNAVLELSLDDAVLLMPNRPRSKRMKRDPFSLYFTGPAEPLLPQGMYNLASDTLNFTGLFLVPVGRGEDLRYEYEAVFT